MTTFIKIITTAIFGIMFNGLLSLAQKDPQFTQYYFNPLSTNSGYAGNKEVLWTNLIVRKQWLGIEGRPRT